MLFAENLLYLFKIRYMKFKIFFLLILMATTSTISAQNNIGVVLSGGGALGYAHLGALQALEEAGIKPAYVAGTSMGALVGAFYAKGMSPSEICDMIKTEKFDELRKIITVVGKNDNLGFSSHRNILKVLKKYIPANSFDSLQKHFAVCATNIVSSQAEIVSSGGHLWEYVLGSASIPGVFEAVKLGGGVYVDGGVMNNMPTVAIRKYCDVVIGIDVNPETETRPKIKNTFQVAFQTLRTLVRHNSVEGREMCDYLIEPMAIEKYAEFDFNKFDEIYAYGYTAMKQYLAAHPEMAQLGAAVR